MADIFNEIADELETISKLADRPEISAAELKAKFDSDTVTLKNAVNKLIRLLNSTIEAVLSGQSDKIPTSSAVAAAISVAGGGDMLKSVYDADGDNVVDNAKKLGNIDASGYVRTDGTNIITGTLVPGNGVALGSEDNRFNIACLEKLNVSGATRIAGKLTADGDIALPNPTIVTATTIDNVDLKENKIYKIPGATVLHIHGEFSSATDGIPSSGTIGVIPSAYRPKADFNTWAFVQNNAGTVLRATAAIKTDGRIVISTQNSKSFRWFRIEAILPQGA